MVDDRPDHAPLGVFDSGLGGLTVVRALRAILPSENIVYLGDTARVPYGTRSADTVVKYARGCARILVDRGVKALVIACNTVSAVAIGHSAGGTRLAGVGVVEPGASAAIKAIDALADSRTEPPPRIGVLGTAGTIASGAYARAVSNLNTRLEVVGQAAPLLVPLVEEGWIEGAVPELAVRKYVGPLIEQGARVLVLGCTHYPLLRPVIERVGERNRRATGTRCRRSGSDRSIRVGMPCNQGESSDASHAVRERSSFSLRICLPASSW